MPWPVYLAFKHLFPTGRKGGRATVWATLRLSFFLALGLFLILLAFFWWFGVFARMQSPLMQAQQEHPESIPHDLLILWLWLTAAVAFVAMIFRSTPFFHAMSILGITLGVTVLITVQSVMNGFAHEYEKVFIQTQGHLGVFANGPIENPKEVTQVLQQVPGVILAEPVVNGMVIMQYKNLPGFPVVRSFDMNNPEVGRDPLAKDINAGQGKFDDLDDQSLLVGAGVFYRFGLRLGDTVEVLSPGILNDYKHDQVPIPRELKVAGVISTGWTGVDQNTVFLSLRLMRELYGFTDEAHSIEVILDHDNMEYTRGKQAALQKALEPLNARRLANRGPDAQLTVETWQQINHDQMQILIVEKTVMLYIMMVIVVVAAFCILCSLATTVVRKTREIGVLGALGARPGQVAAVFCLQGMFIGLVGTFIGIAAAFILLHYRQSIVEAFVDQQQLIEFYKFYSFPVEYRFMDFLKIVGFTFIISTLAGVLPAWWAARLKPAECLRSD